MEACLDFSSTSFVKEVSRARTFRFMRDMEYLRSQNLILGGNIDNAIVIDDYRILNEDGLRYDDEFVKHKILVGIENTGVGECNKFYVRQLFYLSPIA